MCTRVLWSSDGIPGEGTVLVGRSMDWMVDTGTNLWVLPAGIQHDGLEGENSISWTSKNGSIVASMYDTLTVDGLNEWGLNANGLYLTEADYGVRDEARPALGLASTVQYLLDTFSTVAEAVTWIRESRVQIVPVLIGAEQQPGTAHLSLADPSGDSAVVEFLDGETVIHHGSQFTVMANSPAFDEQLAHLAELEPFADPPVLPGNSTSPDRFIRAKYYADRLPTAVDLRAAVAAVLSVVRNASAPFGVVDDEHPNIAPTRWRTLSDLTNRRYYFDSTTAPNLLWADLDRFDLTPGAPILRLDLQSGDDRVGDQSAEFVPGTGFPRG